MIKIAKSLNREYKDYYIELFPKGNVIFANGTTILYDEAQKEEYILKYEQELTERIKRLQKTIFY